MPDSHSTYCKWDTFKTTASYCPSLYL